MAMHRTTHLDSLYRGAKRHELARAMKRYRRMVFLFGDDDSINSLRTFWLRRYSLCYVELKRRQDARRTNKLRNNVW